MQCSKCQEDIHESDKYLNCSLCTKNTHLSCVKDLTLIDYEFLKSTGSSWMCNKCKSTMKCKTDNTPVTPKHSASEAESDSSQGGAKKDKIPCQKCKKGFSFNSHRAECSKCKDVLHFKCIDIPKEEYVKVKSFWLCKGCNMKSTAGHGAQGPLSLDSDKITDERTSMTIILNELKAFRKEVNETHRGFEDNMNKYSEWLTEQGGKIDGINKKLTDVCSDISLIKQENVNLTKKVSELTVKVNHMEQASKENVVEIQGVPYQNQENLMNILSKLSDAVGFNFNENMVDNCFRYKNDNQPGRILVRFVRKIDMEKLIEMRRKKRNLNSRDLGFEDGNATVIYINYSLTQARRKLLNAAKAKKNEKHYTFLWIKSGRIFMRKNPGDRFITIDSEEDLNKVL